MLKKDIKVIDEMVSDERECGYCGFDFDDRQHDLRAMSECIGVDMVYDEEEEEFKFANEKDEQRVNECLDYYYEVR